MPSRARLVAAALGLALTLALVAGCSAGDRGDRRPGDPVTEDEARVLAELLHRNHEAGGADFVVTAPYDEGALTLTGEVDFASGIGRAQAVTERPGGEETRTVFFTREALWFGDVPRLADLLAAAGVPDAPYVRRPATARGDGALLVDVLARLVLDLAADTPDDAAAFLARDYTWEGQRAVDGRQATVFAFGSGESVAVDASEELLLQYVTRLDEPDLEVTVTLSHHGQRRIELPTDGETIEAADHPEIAARVGL